MQAVPFSVIPHLGVSLLFIEGYPRALSDMNLGIKRWTLRGTAYLGYFAA